jgi:hypothetical protein
MEKDKGFGLTCVPKKTGKQVQKTVGWKFQKSSRRHLATVYWVSEPVTKSCKCLIPDVILGRWCVCVESGSLLLSFMLGHHHLCYGLISELAWKHHDFVATANCLLHSHRQKMRQRHCLLSDNAIVFYQKPVCITNAEILNDFSKTFEW